MTKFDDIYELASDNYGLITSAEARGLGVSNNELVQYAVRGKLVRVGQGLYQLTQYVPTKFDTYAWAVALVGSGACLCGESVIAMLELAPTNPSLTHVATSKRIRKELPAGIKLHRLPKDETPTEYGGIPSQSASQAIRFCKNTMLAERLRDAALNARREGYIDDNELTSLAELWEGTNGREGTTQAQ